jgi:homogentisate 1,2-dioxygenase
MAGKWIYRPHLEGQASRQAHADLPPGCVERELGKEGFYGPSTHMIHPRPPTGWSQWEGPLKPRAFDCTRLPARGASPWQADELLYNEHVRLRWWQCAASLDHLVRNADGDELVFVHAGHAELYCDYGHLSLEAGDYLVLPRGTMWRVELPPGGAPLAALLIEATNASYRLPDKGLIGEQAIFDPMMLDVPTIDEPFKAQQRGAAAQRDWRVVVKRRNRLSTVTYPYNPLDALGWHGALYPVRINLRDLRPLSSHRYHLPPSAHTTFLAERFVVCSFVPRPFETDPGAIKVPFFHNNDDYDEVIFYHAGEFFSRDHIHPGMITLHPCGFTHGPHPKALTKMLRQDKPATDEYAVMLDARDALEVGEAAAHIEWAQYHQSWQSA